MQRVLCSFYGFSVALYFLAATLLQLFRCSFYRFSVARYFRAAIQRIAAASSSICNKNKKRSNVVIILSWRKGSTPHRHILRLIVATYLGLARPDNLAAEFMAALCCSLKVGPLGPGVQHRHILRLIAASRINDGPVLLMGLGVQHRHILRLIAVA